MHQILLNETELKDCLDSCREYAEEYCEGQEQELYLNELKEVEEQNTTNGKWGVLITTQIFEKAIGEWAKVEGHSLWVED